MKRMNIHIDFWMLTSVLRFNVKIDKWEDFLLTGTRNQLAYI